MAKTNERRNGSLFLLCLFLIPWTRASAQVVDDEAAISRTLDLLEDCYLNEDLNLLSSLMSDAGFVLVMRRQANPSRALVLNKEQVLQSTARAWKETDYVEHKHTNRRIKVDGPAATSISTVSDRTTTGKPSQWRIFHILANEDGRWRLVFSSPLFTAE